MNTHHHLSFGAQPKRTIPTPRIAKSQQLAASGTHATVPKPDPTLPLKPASVMKAAHTPKHAPWLTTAKIPRISKIP